MEPGGSISQTKPEIAPESDGFTDPNPNKDINKTWQSFKLTRSIQETDTNEYDFPLLVNYKTSIIGDMSVILNKTETYSLDRSMLASKSDLFEQHLFQMRDKSEKKITLNESIDLYYGAGGNIGFRQIVDIIYGKNVKNVIDESNFGDLFGYMKALKMEIDLEIFKQFIEQTVRPKAELNNQMFKLLVCLSYESPKFNYLLPAVTLYFSDRLLDVYQKEEFLLLSVESFIPILLHKSDNVLEKRSIGRVCAEWICYDYENRIENLKDLVNATKHRYGILPYCDWDSNLMVESLRINHPSGEPKVQQVENYFNELFHYLGEAKFEPPVELSEIIRTMDSGICPRFSIGQTNKWIRYLEESLYSDIVINVQGFPFNLHRIKLSTVSGYFYNLFTNPSESLALEIDKSDDESEISEHILDEIDPVAFESIVDYIYKQEIEVTSATHLINLLKGSKFLKMDNLFATCSSKLAEISRDLTDDIFESFQYVCENEKYSEVYNVIVEKIIALWPKLDETAQFVNISLDILKEIVALPGLKIDNTDQVLDLCSKWIFHDIHNRYKSIVKLAKAINRNFMMINEQQNQEIPSNLIDYSQRDVKQQLIRILSSSALVPLNTDNLQNDDQKPSFLLVNKNNLLCVVDANFNAIIQIAHVPQISSLYSSATLVENELFVLFRLEGKFYFQLYDIFSRKMIFLATDTRMDPKKSFMILHCKNEIYFCNNEILLKYSVKLNRWVPFLVNDVGCKKQYTSDGEKLYKIFATYDEGTKKWANRASYYDFEKNSWIPLPKISVVGDEPMRNKANIIKRELGVLFASETFTFNWISQTWASISNFQENFVEFNSRGQNVVYVSNENKVYSYSPVDDEWIQERSLDIMGYVIAIHKVG